MIYMKNDGYVRYDSVLGYDDDKYEMELVHWISLNCINIEFSHDCVFLTISACVECTPIYATVSIVDHNCCKWLKLANICNKSYLF